MRRATDDRWYTRQQFMQYHHEDGQQRWGEAEQIPVEALPVGDTTSESDLMDDDETPQLQPSQPRPLGPATETEVLSPWGTPSPAAGPIPGLRRMRHKAPASSAAASSRA